MKTNKPKIKKGDTVIVIAGKNKGASGAVLRVFPKEMRVVVEGVALAKRHLKGHKGQSGRIVERPAAINISNVMLADPENKKPTRVGRKIIDGKLVRYAKKSDTILK